MVSYASSEAPSYQTGVEFGFEPHWAANHLGLETVYKPYQIPIHMLYY